MKRYLVILIFILLPITICKAVDPQFTQFYSSPLYLSPSYAGATKENRLSTNYRQQWPSIPGGFETYTFAYDRNFANFHSGVGVLLMRDIAGSGQLSHNYVNILYSYDFVTLKKWHIRPGLSFVYKTTSIDFNKLKFYDQIVSSDPNAPTGERAPSSEIRGNIDGAASILAYNSDIWVGFTADHLLKPSENFFGDKIETPMKYTVFGGMKLTKKGRLLKPYDESITVSFLYKQQGDYQQLDLGFYWFKQPIVIGFWYRGIPMRNKQFGDALAFLGGFKMEQFTIGYSYDLTISNLINSTGGTHEISLIFEFQTKTRKKIYHAIPCPEF